MVPVRAQGATEYLVLLAVVLVIALVGTALLGFFPGTATDAQLAESEIYWKSASPIAITETVILKDAYGINSGRAIYIRIRNNGNYQVSVTRILVGNWTVSKVYDGYRSRAPLADMAGRMVLSPGEEGFFGYPGGDTSAPLPNMVFIRGYNDDLWWNDDAYIDMRDIAGWQRRLCYHYYGAEANGVSAMREVLENLGFEYIQYVEGQQITKRQVGTKPLIIKCR